MVCSFVVLSSVVTLRLLLASMSKHKVIWGTPSGGREDAGQLELVQQVVVASTGGLALVNLDEDSGLVVGIGGEHLLLLGGNRRVPRD